MSYNVNRVGQINGAGDVDAMFLKLWSGEVLTTFQNEVKMLNCTNVMTITKGRSYQFPNMGDFSAAYHTPGAQLTGLTTTTNETVINIDDLLVSHVSVANIDEAKSHYPARAMYTERIGVALAQQLDKHLMQLGVLAARTSSLISGRPGGTQIHQATSGAPGSADFANNGSHLAAAMFMAAAELDAKNIPENDRYMIVRPAQYYNLVRSTDVINRDWGGAGAYSDGTVLRVAGLNIIKSNNLPSTDLSAVTDVRAGTGNKYRGNFTNVVGLVFHKSALATVKLFDIGMESVYQVDRQSTLVVAKYAMGHGILRPEAAVEIRAAGS
jgi:hypothetical protein